MRIQRANIGRACTLAGTAFLVAVTAQAAPTTRPTSKPSTPAWHLADLKGKTYRSTDFEGQLLLLDLWLPDSPADQQASRQSLQDRYGTGQGVVILAITPILDAKTKAVLKATPLPYPLCVGNQWKSLPAAAQFSAATTSAALFDTAGQVVWTGPLAEAAKALEIAIAKTPPFVLSKAEYAAASQIVESASGHLTAGDLLSAARDLATLAPKAATDSRLTRPLASLSAPLADRGESVLKSLEKDIADGRVGSSVDWLEPLSVVFKGTRLGDRLKDELESIRENPDLWPVVEAHRKEHPAVPATTQP